MFLPEVMIRYQHETSNVTPDEYETLEDWGYINNDGTATPHGIKTINKYLTLPLFKYVKNEFTSDEAIVVHEQSDFDNKLEYFTLSASTIIDIYNEFVKVCNHRMWVSHRHQNKNTIDNRCVKNAVLGSAHRGMKTIYNAPDSRYTLGYIITIAEHLINNNGNISITLCESHDCSMDYNFWEIDKFMIYSINVVMHVESMITLKKGI